MKFVCGVLLLISLANSLPVPQQSSTNPCTLEALYNVQYFHPYPTDETKYIKCDPWGQMTVKQCPEGSKWHRMASDCLFLNSTLWSTEWIEMKNESMWSEMTLSSSFCSFYGNFSCQNDGVCSQHEDGFRCLCLSSTAGDYCEEKRTTEGTFGRLINESFSIELYKKNRPILAEQILAPMFNSSMPQFDMNMTLSDKMFFHNATLEKVQSYLAQYPNGTLRFDSFVNFFIEDFLAYVFPDAFFLREFSNPIEQQMGFSTAIPKLLMVAKYSYDKFESLFAIYDEILHKLGKYLIEKQPEIQKEAKKFYEIYDLLDNELDRLYNFTSSAEFQLPVDVKDTKITKEMIKAKLWRDFARTLNSSYDLFEMVVDLQDDLSIRKQLYNITQLEVEFAIANFTSSPEFVERINRLMFKNTEIWDVLSFYGFSHVLGDLTGIPIFESPIVQSTFQALMASEVVDEERDDETRGDEQEDEDAETQALMSMLEDDEEEREEKEDTTNFETKALVAEESSSTTLKPKSVRALEESLTTLSPSTTVRPLAQKAETTMRVHGEETTVRPQAQLAETTRPSREEKPSTVKLAALVAESTTVRPAALVAESTTVRPAALVGETTRPSREEKPVRPQALVSESTTVKPQSLVMDEKLTTVKAQAQFAESTTIKMLRNEETLKPAAQSVETTTRRA